MTAQARLADRVLGRVARLASPVRRLVLHVGLPKCGSTAIQVWSDANRDWLLAQGTDYPLPDPPDSVPKHQAQIEALLGGKLSCLRRALWHARAPTLFLSTEGLSNHFFDLRPETLAGFRATTAGIHVSVVLVHRDAEAWISARYKQAVMNAPSPPLDYATHKRLEDYRSLPRIRRFLDIDRLSGQLAAGYGAADVTLIDLRQGLIEPLAALLGVVAAAAPHAPVAANVSVSDDLVEIVRQMNGIGLDAGLRRQFLGLIQTSERTGHTTLIEAERAGPPGQASASALGDVLARIKPENPAQQAILDRLRATLESGVWA